MPPTKVEPILVADMADVEQLPILAHPEGIEPPMLVVRGHV